MTNDEKKKQDELNQRNSFNKNEPDRNEIKSNQPGTLNATKSQVNTDKTVQDSKTTVTNVGSNPNVDAKANARMNEAVDKSDPRSNQEKLTYGTSSPGLQQDLMNRANTQRPVLTIEHYTAHKRATIERILRDKGMDTMQVGQALGLIEETLFDPFPVERNPNLNKTSL